MNSTITVELDPSDDEFKDALKAELGDDVTFVEARSLDGAAVLQVVTEVGPALITLLGAYLSRRRSGQTPKRVVLKPQGKMTLIGYSPAEIREVLTDQQ